ncbi:MAG: hypothetical protein C4K58_03800 [Flavobacteriaceae bacterium]|nr:MAG: hypothetical protein C4K58_03800 [Flavobacteriaceae bacterium]
MSLFDSLKSMATQELISGVAGKLGESNQGVSSAMDAILPSLMGGLLDSKEESHAGIADLLGQASKMGGDNMVSDLISGIGSENSGSGLGSIGTSLVGSLLGGKSSSLIDTVASLSGIKSGSASSLVSIAGSLMASGLGSKMSQGGLDFGSLLKMVSGEKDQIAGAIPWRCSRWSCKCCWKCSRRSSRSSWKCCWRSCKCSWSRSWRSCWIGW